MRIKRLFALLITVALLMTTLMSVSFAYESNDPSDFVIVYGVLTKYTGTDAVVTIPDGVIEIGGTAFGGNTKLTSVTIPNSVTKIGYGSFSGCTALTDVTIPNSVTTIASYNMSGFWYGAFSSCTSLKSVTIPNSMTYIGDFAFSNCTSLTDVTIPNSVTSTGEGIFAYCSALTSFVIPNSFTGISRDMFYNCTNLTNVTIPSSVRFIGGGFDYWYGAFASCKKLTNITIPNSVTDIGGFAFFDTGLTNVTIPNGVSHISEATFTSCVELTSIVIPSSVTSIEQYAFESCVKLCAAQFLGNAPTMGLDVFNQCASNFKVYYISGKTGFANPWYGYQTTTDTYVPPTPTPPGWTPTPTPTPAPTPTPTLTPTPTPTPGTSFTDINGHWAEQYIKTLAAMGIMKGYKQKDGTYEFGPNDLMQRQELAKIITVSYGVYNPLATSGFTDCPVGAWYSSYVGSLEAEGLTNGMGNGTFGAGRYISRQDTATMLSRAMIKYQSITLQDSTAAETVVSTFTDAKYMSDYAKPAIAFFINTRIINGYETSPGSGIFEFRPKANITRAEISKIMLMSLNYVAPATTP